MIGVDACSAMNRSMEHFEVLKVNSKEKFFVTHTDMPLKVTDYYIDSYTTQMREHVLNRLTETFGVDTSDEALRKASPSTTRSARSSPRSAICASWRTRPSPVMNSTSSTWLLTAARRARSSRT